MKPAKHSLGLNKPESLEEGARNKLAVIMITIGKMAKRRQHDEGMDALRALINEYGTTRWEQGYYTGIVSKGLDEESTI